MKSIEKVLLVRLDPTPDGAAASRLLGLARTLGRSVTLAEVMPDHDQVADLFRRDRIRELAALFPALRQEQLRYRLLPGDPTSAVAAAAPSFDLILLADGRLDSIRSRQETTELLRTLSTPIWLDGGTGNRAPRRILAAVDVMTGDTAKRRLNRPILEHALLLAGRFDADLDVLSVVHPPGAAERLFGRLTPRPADGDGRESAAERRLRFLVEEVRREFPQAPQPRLMVAGGSAPELLVHGIDAASVDLLVAGHLERRGLAAWLFGNTVETLRAELDCSILAVKAPPAEDVSVGQSERSRAA